MALSVRTFSSSSFLSRSLLRSQFGFLGCSLKRSTQSWPLGLCIVVPSRKIDVSGCFRLRDFSCARRALRSCVAALNAWFEAMTKQCS
ncbi:hypothetical protein KC359_g54 [Hortaea werneckii]|nr:hypothetical protein KC359_g54 [Hortaea werneckii]